jgi:preprotein translocase subunit SecB
LEPAVRFDQAPGNPNEWRLWLTLKLGSDDPARPFAYEAEMQIQALIGVANHLPAEQKEVMALVNGFSILYSAAREMLLNITARSTYGPVSLPTLSFVNLVQDARKQKAQNQNAPATVPA